MSNIQDLDLDRTIYDYDYTRRAVLKMNRIIDSADFEDMDADAIFHYLSDEMEIVLFPDYLKRYIYEAAEIDMPFREVPDSLFIEILISSMQENKAPYSFTETSIKRSAAIKGWLSHSSVKRETIFILGFVLRMPPQDVSDFLTKVIKETDFDFTDPMETICWFCYKKGLPYVQARKLRDWYDSIEPEEFPESSWQSMLESPEFFLGSLKNLRSYLTMLKAKNISGQREQVSYAVFSELYSRCCSIASDMFNKEEEMIGVRSEKILTADDIRPADIEKILCSGIPVNKTGNLEKMARSRFASLFALKRMSRQRISSILNHQHPVERFDLITLLFFIYAETVEPDWPTERYLQYIDAVNEILEKCGMEDIYPVNPYEAFILMCLITDYPMDVYAEIWERSYEE